MWRELVGWDIIKSFPSIIHAPRNKELWERKVTHKFLWNSTEAGRIQNFTCRWTSYTKTRGSRLLFKVSALRSVRCWQCPTAQWRPAPSYPPTELSAQHTANEHTQSCQYSCAGYSSPEDEHIQISGEESVRYSTSSWIEPEVQLLEGICILSGETACWPKCLLHTWHGRCSWEMELLVQRCISFVQP